MSRRDEIKARLNAAVAEHPVPWAVVASGLRTAMPIVQASASEGCWRPRTVTYGRRQDVCTFIAAAPCDVQWLLDELEYVEAALERCQDELSDKIERR